MIIIPDDHLAIILTALNESPSMSQADLPKEVVEEYQRHKVIADRINLQLSPRDLLMIVVAASRSAPPPKPNSKTINQLWKAKELKHGDPVLAKWRGEHKPAQILDVRGRSVTIRFFDGPDERAMDMAHVQVMPEDYDLDGYLETIRGTEKAV